MNGINRFAGKVIIVTGAASGMGRAALIRLVAEGGIVTGIDVNEEGLKETIALAGKAGGDGRACYEVASIAEEADVKRVMDNVISKEGKLDVLINMAGILRSSHTTQTSVEEFQFILNINLTGTFLFCREALPHLLKTKGNIVNAASTSAFFGHPYMAAYSASKGAIASMTHALAWEYLKQGVRVNAIAPGGIATPMIANPFGKIAAEIDLSLFGHLARPDQRFGQPEEAAAVIAFLASDDASFMNDEVVKVDGGNHS